MCSIIRRYIKRGNYMTSLQKYGQVMFSRGLRTLKGPGVPGAKSLQRAAQKQLKETVKQKAPKPSVRMKTIK